MYKLIKQSGRARRGEFTTPHGTVQTPVFMNVGTQGAIKGALSARDLREIVARDKDLIKSFIKPEAKIMGDKLPIK